MKKTLLLQTALVAASGLFAADIASAQAKTEPLGVSVGGYLTEVFKVKDNDGSRTQLNTRSSSFGAPDAEIYFNVRGVLDNGTVVGARIELEAATEADQIDERYIFIERRDAGRAEIGSIDRASSKMVYGAPVAIPGYGTIDPTGAISVTQAPTGARTGGNLTKFTFAPDDAEGINLYTASDRYLGSKAGKGLQLGFSYVPDGCEDFSPAANGGVGSASVAGSGKGCGGGFGLVNNPGQVSDAIVVAANYLESFGAFDLGVLAAYNRFDLEATSAGSLSSGAATVFSGTGLQGYAIGSTLTYNIGDGSSVQFGGAWKREEMGVTQSGDDRRNLYAAGLRYLTNGTRAGSIGLGVDYARTKADQGNIAGTAVGGEDEFTWYSLGVTYQVARGVLAFGGVGRYEYEDAIAAGTVVGGTAQLDNNSEATFGVAGLRLDF